VYALIATLAAGVLFKHLSPFLVNTSLVIFHMYFIVVLSMLSYLIDLGYNDMRMIYFHF